MSAVDIFVPRATVEEGFRAKSYRDTAGNLTIGYGFDMDAGISEFAARALLIAQATEREAWLQQFDWYTPLDDVRKSVVLDVAFNGGEGGLLHYPHMIAALARSDWATAASECAVKDEKLDASRYAPLRQLLLTGAT